MEEWCPGSDFLWASCHPLGMTWKPEMDRKGKHLTYLSCYDLSSNTGTVFYYWYVTSSKLFNFSEPLCRNLDFSMWIHAVYAMELM
jgi:hypothetical protein